MSSETTRSASPVEVGREERRGRPSVLREFQLLAARKAHREAQNHARETRNRRGDIDHEVALALVGDQRGEEPFEPRLDEARMIFVEDHRENTSRSRGSALLGMTRRLSGAPSMRQHIASSAMSIPPSRSGD